MTASRSYVGLPFNNATIIIRSAMYMTVYTIEILCLLMTIFFYLQLQPGLILYLFTQFLPPLIHIGFPFLWIVHSFGIPYLLPYYS